MSKLLPLALVTTAMLGACEKKPASAQDQSAQTTQASAAPTDVQPATQTQPGTLPAGYTEVPPLSKSPVRHFDKVPAYALQDGKDYYAVLDTSKGQIVVDLLENETPTTVNNFVTLARNHFYDGLRFHRVIDGFMAQSGDPKSADDSQKAAWGTGGPGYTFPDEIRQNLTFDKAGMLAMANSGPNTNGSQFFITFAPATFLNGSYSLFGKVVSGQDVLSKLTRTASTAGGAEAPIAGAEPDKLLSVRIVTKP